MSNLSLANRTGNEQIDQILHGIISLYEATFPGYIRAYYLTGSYADGSSVPISDIDFTIIFANPLSQTQLDQARGLIQQCARFSPLRLDISLTLETQLSGIDATLLKLGSLFVYGMDIRETLQLPPMARYQQDVTWSPYRFLGQVLRGQQALIYPLTYPDVTDPFYGYTQKRLAHWYPPSVQEGTKEWIAGMARTATALLALRAQHYVGTKRDSIRHYRTFIGDEWADYLETLYQKGKVTWHYTVPPDPAEQQLLRELCRQSLAFENHYFQVYRHYLLDLLQRTAEEQLFAARRLAEVVYSDEQMRQTLQQVDQTADPTLHTAIVQALSLLEQAGGDAKK